MARTYNLYKKGTAEAILKAATSPVKITGLAAGTVVAKGAYLASAIDDALPESDKVELPGFTVLPAEG